jgi:hypothetical protein
MYAQSYGSLIETISNRINLCLMSTMISDVSCMAI